jgi:hypothetical protein
MSTDRGEEILDFGGQVRIRLLTRDVALRTRRNVQWRYINYLDYII